MSYYNLFWMIPLIVVLFLIGLRIRRRRDSENSLSDALIGVGIPHLNIKFKHDYVTPGGVAVRSTVPVPARALELIDEGISNQIERWNRAHPHYEKGDFLNEYSVLFVDPMAWNKETPPGSPAIMVGGLGAGIQAAGTCCGARLLGWPLVHIVLPHQAWPSPHLTEAEKAAFEPWRFEDYLMRSAWHESEHIRPSVNDDFDTFDKYTRAGDIHPHIP